MDLLLLTVIFMSPPLVTHLESSLSTAAIYTKPLSLKERASQQGKLNSGLIRGINQSYRTAHHLQVHDLIKGWKGLLSAQVWRQWGDAL